MSSAVTAFWKLLHGGDSALLHVPAVLPNHQMISILKYSEPTFCNFVFGDEGEEMEITNLHEEMGSMVQLETLHISRVCAETI